MLNSPVQHGMDPSDRMPCVKIKEEADGMEVFDTSRYMSQGDFKVENPYDGPYVTKHDISCEDLKVESPYDGMYDDRKDTTALSRYADDNQPFFSDDDSSRGSSEDGEIESEDNGGTSDPALHTDSDSYLRVEFQWVIQ
ncbi:hypothetical protein N1851_030685 [Merluccius polli]|uniref:Uncharacterized protein n=1 Tax=Merluccius polli TaxID=89951 RepID=A0AA47M561_MERPO|nr:hypothetical protein N1851_030685 [Merluccius polli]